MKQTWQQNYNEIKEAYKPSFSSPKLHGEEVVRFEIKFETATTANYYQFEAPRCSSRDELMMYAYYQVESSTLKSIICEDPHYEGYKKNIGFRIV